MNLLLDTHVLLWWLTDEPSLSADAREAIRNPDNAVFLSAAVIWEIRIKEAIGKLELPADFRQVLGEQSFREIGVTVEHAHEVGLLPPVHRDPFDRMLVAQARREGFTIVTRDASIPLYEVPVIGA